MARAIQIGMNAQTKTTTRLQREILTHLAAGAFISEEWGCDTGATGTARAKYFYNAAIYTPELRRIRTLRGVTVDALRSQLRTIASGRGWRKLTV
jgi:hypothetical protein